MADAQTERAYQKQPTIFQNKKRILVADGGKEVKEKLPRYHKSVGLGFKTPREAQTLQEFGRASGCSPNNRPPSHEQTPQGAGRGQQATQPT
ncbi:40S ribosomal protein S11 [Lates japonicus]|uniref:40S ribosomal protein S11 n=1 Tax=Lates japonicus TaxID=270547 RepID=A0AAD3M7I8_LATJO|nr:40S ribosomal protein S11 [Lates japonicus]